MIDDYDRSYQAGRQCRQATKLREEEGQYRGIIIVTNSI
tara:strand:- start:180 stop:296 length:117 start_codon:yes stop_codon:yes gene_type:complete